MKRAAWINLALLLIVGALALFIYFKPPSANNGYRLSAMAPAAVRNIRIETNAAPPVLLERSGTDWRLTAPFEARADAFQVQRVLAIVEAQTPDRLPATDLARFDLLIPHTRLTVDGQVFAFGMFNELTRQQYVLTQDNVYLVGLNYGAALPADPLRLVNRQLFAPDEIPVAFEFPNFKLLMQEGRWQLSPPADDASQDDFNRWVDDWRSASALALQAATSAPRKSPLTIKVTLKDGTQLTLAVIERSPALLLMRNDQPFVYQFADELAQRLLAPPDAVLKPPMNADTRR